VGDDVSVDSESLMVIDFVNLKINRLSFSEVTMVECVFILKGVSIYMWSIFFCAVLKKWSGRSVELTRPRETVEMARHGR
jgi:hypothetical protein